MKMKLMVFTFLVTQSIFAQDCLVGKNLEHVCTNENISLAGINGVVKEVDLNTNEVTIALNDEEVVPFTKCVVPQPNLGNTHRNYDAKFRACRAKAAQLGLDSITGRMCSAFCMKH